VKHIYMELKLRRDRNHKYQGRKLRKFLSFNVLQCRMLFPGPHDIRWFFGTWFFADGFLFPVKELGFWTNPGHWVRVLDDVGSYMYIVL
jgi:hypothetical protein